MTKKITGKKLSIYEKDKWTNLADLLILELEVAAKKTSEISSLPAFLTEVLRRKLFVSREVGKTEMTNRTPDNVGKPEVADNFTISLMTGEERKIALVNLLEFKDDDTLDDFKKWYLEEDWNWLMENLKSN